VNLAERFRHWVPIRIFWKEGRPLLDWCYLGETRFTDPFFEQTITSVLHSPFASLFRHHTPVEFAGELADVDPPINPSGFIYHMSRCGSTLVSRMLAQLPSSIVASEPPILDEVLRARGAHSPVDRETRIRWVKWIVGTLGRRRFPEESRFFVKLDCWSICDFELVHAAFPDVPWMFVYRTPLEVLVSQHTQPSRFTVPGYLDPTVLGLEPGTALTVPRHEYCARILSLILETALRHMEQYGGLAVEYRQLPEAVSRGIADAFSLTFTEPELEVLRAASKIDAKNPSFEFESDAERKQSQASPSLREACVRWLDRPYQRIEVLRAC
jgi:hypothetical protein